MLQWTTAGAGPRSGLLVHHTDRVREFAFDRASDVGRLDRALEAAPAEGWTAVDLKTDWARIWSGEECLPALPHVPAASPA